MAVDVTRVTRELLAAGYVLGEIDDLDLNHLKEVIRIAEACQVQVTLENRVLHIAGVQASSNPA